MGYPRPLRVSGCGPYAWRVRRVQWLLVVVLLASACSGDEIESGPAPPSTSPAAGGDGPSLQSPLPTIVPSDTANMTSPSTAQEQVDPNLGMSIDAYLALPSTERRLYDLGAMPLDVVDAFDLVPLYVRVSFPRELADSYEAIGFETPVGFVGPYVIGAVGPQPVIGSAPRDGTIRLIGWPHGSAIGVVSEWEVICPAVPEIVISELKPQPLPTDVIEVTCTSGTVTVVDGLTGIAKEP